MKDAPEANEIFFWREDGVDRGDGKTQQVGRCLFIQKFRKYSRPKFLGKDPFKKSGLKPEGFHDWSPREVHSLSTENGGLVRESRTSKMD